MMQLSQFNAIRRNYKRTMDAILSPRFAMTPELLKELLTQHALDLEDWLDEEWARFHALEPCGDLACLYAIVPGKECQARVPSPGTHCPGCFPHQRILQLVKLYRNDRVTALRATATLDPEEYDEVIQQAKVAATDCGLEVFITDDLLSWRSVGRTVQFVFMCQL